MTTKFAHCHLDEETGLVWCQHHNGSWAPPFKAFDVEDEGDGEGETAITPEE